MSHLFRKQLRDFNNDFKKISRNFVRKYINIDSNKRIKTDKIVSVKINTIKEFLKIINNRVYIIIINPLQLDPKEEKIPDNIKIIFNWVSIIDKDSNKMKPSDILGIASDKILFSKLSGKPIFEIYLENYTEDNDRGYYLVKDLYLKKNGIFGITNKEGFMEIRKIVKIEKGYPLPNNYKINFEYNFKNIVAIRLLSCMFPIPNKLVHKNISYTVYLSIKELFYLRNIELEYITSLNYNLILDDLLFKIKRETSKFNIYPILSSKKYYILFLLKLDIIENNIKKLVKNDNLYFLFLASKKKLYINQILWINTSNNKGIYKVINSYYFRIKISIDSNENKLSEGSKIYKEGVFIGIIYNKINLKSHLLLDIILYQDNNLYIGNIITSDNVFSGEILEITLLGENNIPIVIKINSIPDDIFLPSIKGIYSFIKFNLKYSKNNILSALEFNNLGKYSYNINNISKIYTIKSKLKLEGKNTVSLLFNSDILPEHNLYQIVSIISNENKTPKKQIEYNVSLISEDDDKNNLFLDRDIKNLNFYNYVPCFSNNNLPFYRKIIDIDYDTNRITIEKQDNDHIDKIIIPESDLKIIEKKEGTLVKSLIKNDIIRGERMITIEKNYNFIPGYIVQLSEGNIENNQTDAELNVIEEINETDEEKFNLLLKYPIINHWEYGTTLIQKYPYLEINEFVSQKEVIIKTKLEIIDKVGSTGVLNLFSKTLIDDNEEQIELPEYFVKIDNIYQEGDNIFRIEFTEEINYPRNLLEYYDYLVLFLDSQLNNISFSTYNIMKDDGWRTRIFISDLESISENLINNEIIITGMNGETTPIFGLTYDDSLSRELITQDLEMSEEYYSSIITNPHNSKVLKISSVGQNYIEIYGRYNGRGGLITLLDNNNSNFDLDLYFSDIKASKLSNNYYKSYFNSNLIEDEILNKLNEKELVIKIIPLDLITINKTNIIDDKYFLMYSPNLDNLIEVPNNKMCENKSDTLVRNPFNRILLNYRDISEEYIYDSFLPIEKTFYQNPIKELYELEFSFLWTDGQPVNFGNKEHNFVLEITEEEGTLEKINPRTGNTNI